MPDLLLHQRILNYLKFLDGPVFIRMIENAVYRAPFGILVTLDDEPASDDPRLVSLPLSSLLLIR